MNEEVETKVAVDLDYHIELEQASVICTKWQILSAVCIKGAQTLISDDTAHALSHNRERRVCLLH